MVFPIGVSVLDFLAVLKAIRIIKKALGEGHGSAARFAGIKARLSGLEAALKELEAIDWKDEAAIIARQQTILNCHGCIQKINTKLEKFESSLQPGGSSSKLKDQFRKVQFPFSEGEIAALETEILGHTNIVLLLVNSVASTAQIDAHKKVADMKQKLIRITEQLAEARSQQTAFNTALTQLANELRRLLQTIICANMAIIKAVASLQDRVAKFGPYEIYNQALLDFQDARGSDMRLDLKCIEGWPMLQDMLCSRWKEKPGEKQVRSENYKLQDARKLGEWSEIDRTAPFDHVFRPGGRVDMTMVFPHDQDKDLRCPRCGSPESPEANPSKVQCQNPECHLRYSRADNVWTEVLLLPAHFQMPQSVPTVRDTDDVILDHGTPLAVSKDEEQTPAHSDMTGEPRDGRAHVADAPAISNPIDGVMRLDDFANIYFGMAPMVYLRALTGEWYGVPWRLVRTIEGIEFLIRNFCKQRADAPIVLRDWVFGHEIDQAIWHDEERGVYFGMVAELVDTTSRAVTQGIRADAASPTWTCGLCHEVFFTETHLAKHAQGHIRHVPCLSACAICKVD